MLIAESRGGRLADVDGGLVRATGCVMLTVEDLAAPQASFIASDVCVRLPSSWRSPNATSIPASPGRVRFRRRLRQDPSFGPRQRCHPWSDPPRCAQSCLSPCKTRCLPAACIALGEQVRPSGLKRRGSSMKASPVKSPRTHVYHGTRHWMPKLLGIGRLFCYLRSNRPERPSPLRCFLVSRPPVSGAQQGPLPNRLFRRPLVVEPTRGWSTTRTFPSTSALLRAGDEKCWSSMMVVSAVRESARIIPGHLPGCRPTRFRPFYPTTSAAQTAI